MTPALQMHEIARQRFDADPSKAYQRHIREVYAEQEPRAAIPSLDGATVVPVSTAEAKQVIEKFEWLQTMGSGTRACYGLKLGDELLGVVCFSTLGGGKVREICQGETPEETRALAAATVCLCRGACVPHAPKNAASFLIRGACRQAYRDHGWKIFFAYSDAAAGEIGTVYQAVGWDFLGNPSRKGKYHTNYRSPDGTKLLTSYAVNHRKLDRVRLMREGWTPVRDYGKAKWVWFEGTPAERRRLRSLCRYPFLPYPKRDLLKAA